MTYVSHRTERGLTVLEFRTFFGRKKEYIGKNVTWREYPSMRSVTDSTLALELEAIDHRIQWNEKDL
jgi:hypothetical protein